MVGNGAWLKQKIENAVKLVIMRCQMYYFDFMGNLWDKFVYIKRNTLVNNYNKKRQPKLALRQIILFHQLTYQINYGFN